ncbi:peptide transporter [Undibacterium sp.]|uniref:peptide transporter n=1 Tax=Undibacterium sp. TaxID=1914977 RepID=UPI003750A6D1
MNFNLERFEYLSYSRKHAEATQELFNLLQIMEKNYSIVDSKITATVQAGMRRTPELADSNIFARIATAISILFSDPSFSFSDQLYFKFIPDHRWFGLLFSVSPLRNADHIIYSFNQNGTDLGKLTFDNKDLAKVCMLYTFESDIKLDFNTLWLANKVMAANLFMVLMTPRLLGSPSAAAKREKLLRWLPGRLEEIDNIDLLPMGVLQDVFLNCSYSGYDGKHNIKRSINTLARKKIVEWDLTDHVHITSLSDKEKPIMLVVLEWFRSDHSVYRVLSKAIHSARSKFHLIGIGIGMQSLIDETGKSVFDEFIELQTGNGLQNSLRQIKNISVERKAQVLYMPSVGMSVTTIFLANLRIAPLQITTLGHSASTFASEMDCFLIDEDFVGDKTCFSERVIMMPIDAFPFVPSISKPENLTQAPKRSNPAKVQVAVAASTMKLNPEFLMTCKQIAEHSTTPMHFHFFVGFAVGMMLRQVKQVIVDYLGECVTIYAHQSYESYLQEIAKCDLYINPFPFGNMNGVVDMMSVGLIGVCKSGREPHEHIDEGLFKRLGMPQWLVTRTNESYINAALRLINNHEERLKIREQLAGKNTTRCLFEGKPELFGETIMHLYLETTNSRVPNACISDRQTLTGI